MAQEGQEEVVMIYIALTLGVVTSALSYFLYLKITEVVTLQQQLKNAESTIDVLEKQNETLTKAAKRSNPDYDIDKLFSGGY